MRITKYRTELDENLHNVLVKESRKNYQVDALDAPKKVVDMLNNLYHMNRLAEEHVYILGLSSKSKVLGVFELSHGSVNATLCSPREIFTRLLLCGAVNFIMAHNHPSGVTDESREDVLNCKRIKESGEMMNVTLLDNIIIAGDGYLSFREQGIL